MTGAWNPDPHPVLDASRHPDTSRHHLRNPSAPPAILARDHDDTAATATRRTRLRTDHLPKQTLPHSPYGTSTTARATLPRLRPPFAIANRAPLDRLYLYLTLNIGRRLLERNLYFNFNVAPAARGSGASASEEGASERVTEAITEKGFEDVLEAAERVAA